MVRGSRHVLFLGVFGYFLVISVLFWLGWAIFLGRFWLFPGYFWAFPGYFWVLRGYF